MIEMCNESVGLCGRSIQEVCDSAISVDLATG